VAVLKREHADYMPCGAVGSNAIAPWPAGFLFYINASLGTGADLFHGSPNGDEVNTNAVRIIRMEGVWPVWSAVLGSPADHSSFDMACGWGGHDRLYGDEDDDYTIGQEDWLDGGPGNDTCDGDWNLGDLPEDPRRSMSDLWRNCEAHSDAYSDESLNLIDCAATDDPLHEWSVRRP
jgi:hypothetical protein